MYIGSLPTPSMSTAISGAEWHQLVTDNVSVSPPQYSYMPDYISLHV